MRGGFGFFGKRKKPAGDRCANGGSKQRSHVREAEGQVPFGINETLGDHGGDSHGEKNRAGGITAAGDKGRAPARGGEKQRDREPWRVRSEGQNRESTQRAGDGRGEAGKENSGTGAGDADQELRSEERQERLGHMERADDQRGETHRGAKAQGTARWLTHCRLAG